MRVHLPIVLSVLASLAMGCVAGPPTPSEDPNATTLSRWEAGLEMVCSDRVLEAAPDVCLSESEWADEADFLCRDADEELDDFVVGSPCAEGYAAASVTCCGVAAPKKKKVTPPPPPAAPVCWEVRLDDPSGCKSADEWAMHAAMVCGDVGMTFEAPVLETDCGGGGFASLTFACCG